MNETVLRQQLRDCAQAAGVAWPQLIQSWNWSEINANDEVRRLLVRAVAWANDVGERGARVDPRSAECLITDIDQLSWPEPALPLRQLIRRCAELALNLAPMQAPPRINEFDLYRISDAARILLTVRAAERAVALLSEAAITSAHHAALRAALDWARAIGEGRMKLEEGAGSPFLQGITRLSWPGRSAHIADSVACCLNTAGNPWIWEMSQARYQHLVASVDLQHAVLAGVSEDDIGRVYLELQHLNE